MYAKLYRFGSGAGLHPRSSQNSAYRKRIAGINTSAKRRFLIMPDGTVWHRQPGQTHHKHIRSRQENKSLQKLVRASKPVLKRVFTLMNYKEPRVKAEDHILRKFNQQRIIGRHMFGMNDRGTGTRMFG